jgi:hypothetical protein
MAANIEAPAQELERDAAFPVGVVASASARTRPLPCAASSIGLQWWLNEVLAHATASVYAPSAICELRVLAS